MVHDVVRQLKYFLLAAPDCFYLWDPSTSVLPDAPPTYEVDPSSILGDYLALAGLSRESPRGSVFETIVGTWLQSLVNSDDGRSSIPASQQWVVDSGLLSEMRGGRVEYEVRA